MPNATRQISSSHPLQTPPSTELQDGIPLPEPVHLHTFLSNNKRFSITSCTAPSFDSCCAARVKAKKPEGFRNIMFSKSTRIAILLGVDSSFFLLELIVGYAVHSLALVADSFHMLNDVLSLCVGLWAVRIANKESSKMYTYGWQRAETLGALINGVFLIALCLSIFLEAIQRFVTPQTVSNPKLVLIVGCFGLLSNVLGLFLFHEHGHSHGEEDEHSHKHDPVSSAEEGHSHSHIHAPEHTKPNMVDVSSPQKSTEVPLARRSTDIRRHRRTSESFVDTIHVHPASFRNEIIAASRLSEQEESEPEEEAVLDDDITPALPNERSGLMKHSSGSPMKYTHSRAASHASLKKKSHDHRHDSWHATHIHNKPKDESTKGAHSHGDLNMRGIFLHVMGDALGNIGVIASALFIWLTSYKWRYYADPAISLIITAIILASAVPLCKAASRILLQAVPTGMSVDDIKADIEDLPRVISAHHIHVWQLSNTKHIASLHVQVDCDIHGAGSESYMHLAREIRECLHKYGIHSSTIQPEFCVPSGDGSPKPGSSTTAVNSSGQDSPAADKSCLLNCGDGCADKNQCCVPWKDHKNGI